MYTEDHQAHYRGKKRKSKKGLHGTEQAKGKSGAKNTGMELTKPLLVVGGLLVGNLAGKAIDKFIPVDAEATGFQIKSIVKPLVQAGLGVGIILVARDNDKDQGKKSVQVIKEVARSFGYGVAGSSLVSAVKLVNKDLLAGLGDTAEGAKPIEAKYYREAKDEIMKMLQDNSFQPALPQSTSGMEGDEESEMSGLDLGEPSGDEVLGIEDAEII